ncbi:MAG TPA: hypothetical protein VHX12_07855 [Acidisoma sp.]|nr:hypothetical protein [Acidisoma sp.]
MPPSATALEADSVELHGLAWQEAFARFGHDVTFEQARSQIGKGGDQLIPAVLSAAGQDDHGLNRRNIAGITDLIGAATSHPRMPSDRRPPPTSSRRRGALFACFRASPLGGFACLQISGRPADGPELRPRSRMPARMG